MDKTRLVLVAILAVFLLGATAIDKNEEQSCKDRWVTYAAEFPGTDGDDEGQAPSRSCGGFLPW